MSDSTEEQFFDLGLDDMNNYESESDLEDEPEPNLGDNDEVNKLSTVQYPTKTINDLIEFCATEIYNCEPTLEAIKSKGMKNILKRFNEVGCFHIDPFSFAIIVLKLKHKISELSCKYIAYTLINYLSYMSNITTTYKEPECDIKSGYIKLSEQSKLRILLTKLNLDEFIAINFHVILFGRFPLVNKKDIKDYKDKDLEYVPCSAGLNMACVLFIHFNIERIDEKNSFYNYPMFGPPDGNCAFHGYSLVAYLNHKEIFEKLKIVPTNMDINNVFHKICLTFNLYFYVFHLEFSYMTYAFKDIKYINGQDDIRNYELWSFVDKVYESTGKYPESLDDIYKQFGGDYINDYSTYEDDWKDDDMASGTIKYVTLDKPASAAIIEVYTHAFAAFVDPKENVVIFTDNNTNRLNEYKFERTLNGLHKAILFLERYVNDQYDGDADLFRYDMSKDDLINNLYVLLSRVLISNHDVKIKNANNFAFRTLHNLFTLFTDGNTIINTDATFITKSEQCGILHKFDEDNTRNSFDILDVRTREVIGNVKDIAKDMLIKFRQLQTTIEAPLFDLVLKYKNIAKEEILNIAEHCECEVDINRFIINMHPSSMLVSELGQESSYFTGDLFNKNDKYNNTITINDKLLISDDFYYLEDYNKEMPLTDLFDLYHGLYTTNITLKPEEFHIHSKVDSIDNTIRTIITYIKNRQINGHSGILIEYNKDVIYALLVFAFCNKDEVTYKIRNKQFTNFIIDFSKVDPDIVTKLFRHNVYINSKSGTGLVRSNSRISLKPIKLDGGNLHTLIEWLIIIILIILVVIVIIKFKPVINKFKPRLKY